MVLLFRGSKAGTRRGRRIEGVERDPTGPSRKEVGRFVVSIGVGIVVMFGNKCMKVG